MKRPLRYEHLNMKVFSLVSRCSHLRGFVILKSMNSSSYLGNKVGSQATLEKAETLGELMRASSVTPPDFESGPMVSTLHKMSSLQKASSGS